MRRMSDRLIFKGVRDSKGDFLESAKTSSYKEASGRAAVARTIATRH
jgi:hypothetical protein